MPQIPVWKDPMPSPCIIYPAGLAPDFGFVSGSLAAASATAWGVGGAGVAAVISTGNGEQIGTTVKWANIGGSNSYISTGVVPAPFLDRPSPTVLTFAPAAVNTATDKINLPAHGWKTGDPVWFSTTTTLPAPLVLGTKYFVIFSDADNIQVATTLANAISATAIDITTQGTGTHYATPDSAVKLVFLARVKCTATVTNDPFSCRLRYYGGASGTTLLTSEADQTLFTTGTTLPADGVWRVMRVALTPTVPLDAGSITAKGLDLTVGFFGGANNSTVYLDWIAVGFECNFGNFGPSQLGAFISKKMDNKKEYDRTLTKADDGTVEVTIYNQGLRKVKFQTTAFDESALAIYRGFHDFCSKKAPFMLLGILTDVSRDFIQFLALSSDQDGIQRVKGTPYYTATIEAGEVVIP